MRAWALNQGMPIDAMHPFSGINGVTVCVWLSCSGACPRRRDSRWRRHILTEVTGVEGILTQPVYATEAILPVHSLPKVNASLTVQADSEVGGQSVAGWAPAVPGWLSD